MHRLNAKTAQLTDFSGSINRVRFDHRFAHPTSRSPSPFGPMLCGVTCAPSSSRNSSSASISGSAKTEKRECSTVNEILLGHESDGHGHMRWLERISGAWDDFQESRMRDAVYGYLDAVFAIVEHYKVRRRTKRLLRRAAKFSGLPLENNADPFTAVIRCTSGNGVDSKTISKWARALRYVAHRKEPRTRLKTFMKEVGGVNACSDLYAKCCGEAARNRSGAPP